MNGELKIVYLEDNPADAELIKRILKKSGLEFTMQVVVSRSEYENSILQFNPDIILSDNALPQFDSNEALRICRDYESCKYIPFILVTGSLSEEIAVAYLKAGMDDYVLKNNLTRLPAAIEQALKQREAEKKLEDNRRQFQYTIDSMLEGVQIIGYDWKYLYVNNAVAKQGKYSKEELLGYSMMEKYPGIDQTHMFQGLRRCMEKRVPLLMENEFAFPDGSKGWFELSIQPAPEGIVILSVDITERKKIYERLTEAEAQAKNFAAHLNKTLEEERTSIAREVHDELGQQLAGIKIGLRSLVQIEGEKKISGMLKDVDDTLQSLRKIATQLRPGILDTLGLLPSIEWLGKQFKEKTGINCNWTLDSDTDYFEKNISTCFFRICQEALTNISKHAEATEVNIEVKKNEKELVLKITDNGKGMTGENLTNPFSMGLLGMRERASMIGGKLSIDSEKNKGTSVFLSAIMNS